MKFFEQTFFFAINSVRKLRKAPLPIFIAFICPVLAWLCIALTYQNSSVENIPIAIVDLDNSPMSRMAARYLDGTGTLTLVDVYSNPSIAEEKYRKQEVYYIVTIPKDFQKKVKLGTGSEITVQFNGGRLIYSKIGYKAIAQCLSTISAGVTIKRLEAKGLASDDALAKAVPISTQLNVLGNPYFDYGIYLIPGMLFALLQMSASTCTLWMFRAHRESEAGRIVPNFDTLIPYLIGRGLPLFIANALALVVVFLVIFPLVGIQVSSIYFNMFLLTCLFTFASMGMGAFLSINMKNLVTASQALLVINAPAFVFSGYTFPIWAMPELLQYVSQMIPLTHFLDGFFPMFIYGVTTERGIVPLIIISFVFWGGTILSVLGYDLINKFKSHIKLV